MRSASRTGSLTRERKVERAAPRPKPSCSLLAAAMSEFPVPPYRFLDIWQALGGDPLTFDEWMAEPRRSPADAWSQLMAAIRGDLIGLLADDNPPANELLPLVAARTGGPDA